MRPRLLVDLTVRLAILGGAVALATTSAAAQKPVRPTDRATGQVVPLATRRPTAASIATSAAEAAQRGDLSTVRQLIAAGGDVNAAQGDGMTALHWAAERGDSAMLTALLRAHADANARTRIGSYTPLHLAARTGNPATVRALLAASTDVKATTASGATALHLAATAGNAQAVKALLARGADANAREAVWGQTPLIFAAENDRAAAVTALLAGGADPSIRTRVVNLTEQAARIQAAEKKRVAILISYEPPARHDSAEADYKRALTAAKAAQAATRPAAAKPGADSAVAANPRAGDPGALVTTAAQGAGLVGRLPVREPRGPFTPEQIQVAIDSGRAVLTMPVVSTDSVKEQVDTANGGVQGYVKQVGSVGGLTALHHAARQGSVGAAAALVAGGANVNDTSYVDHMTPLLVATMNGQFDVALKLVQSGADPNVATTYGMTPLYATINAQWAPKSRYPQPQAIMTQQTSYMTVVEALLAKGANANARLTKQPWWFAYNNCGSANCGLEVIDGTTPFWRAAYSLDVDAMRLLKKNGADENTPSIPPAPAARTAGAGARAGADSAAKRRAGDTTAVASRRAAVPAMPAEAPAHPSAGANAPSMTPNTVPAPTAPVVAANDRTATRGPGTGTGATPAAGGGRAAGGAAGAQGLGDPQFPLDPDIAVAAKAAPIGAGVYPIHAAAGVGYGNGFAGNSHRHAPDAWMPTMRYLVEELHADVNARDNFGYTPLHHAAARGDNEMILYLVAHGADVKAVSKNGRTVVDMANGPVQRLRPYVETIALLEKLGSKNQHHCVSC